MRSRQTTFISVYLTPNEPIAQFRQKLFELEDMIRNAAGDIVMGGDFNARAVEWGMPAPDARGRDVLELAARTGLLVQNVGRTPTLQRPGCAKTIPDVTFASERIAPLIESWRVINNYNGSDHQYIAFNLKARLGGREVPPSRPLRWNVERVNEVAFEEVIGRGSSHVQHLPGPVHPRELADCTMGVIAEACATSMPRKRPRNGRHPMYWWTAEIADLRRECLRLRRLAQRELRRSRGRGPSITRKKGASSEAL